MFGKARNFNAIFRMAFSFKLVSIEHHEQPRYSKPRTPPFDNEYSIFNSLKLGILSMFEYRLCKLSPASGIHLLQTGEYAAARSQHNLMENHIICFPNTFQVVLQYTNNNAYSCLPKIWVTKTILRIGLFARAYASIVKTTNQLPLKQAILGFE